ncbi:tigger transposable element-derived protein 1 [Trichonephila inaurata madagascariensis]|uniref:Tigger transposable element-derived protein 1 n=1 Tax=Trichonephila inaurata madagascariensis TaxID=2747483 RepID=A0A8X6MAP6_9ARAC|nr:tigger transposable element-derived protein 1 [Trichonephila inaurata madagascariensis]
MVSLLVLIKKQLRNTVSNFKNSLKQGYRLQQIFSCDETGLFWKRMPNRTYITKDEKSVPGHKPIKDRLTLLLGANASGDMKLKPHFSFTTLRIPEHSKKIP